jgi:demethylmenaquinone methyltransferase/2-methoxy-6-polyprenyl-1,4-benzoquinol methylase
VVKPGGRVVVCEFSQPPLAAIRAGYSAYLKYGMPVLARVASSNPAAYEYLMDSIQAWPNQRALAGWLREAGFERVAYRNLTAGIVALHRGIKPERPEPPVEPERATPAKRTPAAKKPAATKTTTKVPTASSAKAAGSEKPVPADSASTIPSEGE